MAQHVGHLALPGARSCWQTTRGGVRSGRRTSFDRMAEWPVAEVVQQRRYQEQLPVFRAHCVGKPRVVGKLLEQQEGEPVHAQAMLESCVEGGRVDERHQSQLTYLSTGGEIPECRSALTHPAPSAARQVPAESAPGSAWYPSRPLPGISSRLFIAIRPVLTASRRGGNQNR